MKISNFKIGSGKVFVIAEIGNNHNGCFERAIQMVDDAIDIGVDCVKFQMRQIKEVYRERSLKKDGEDLGTEYVIDLLKKFELSLEEHKKVAKYCEEKNNGDVSTTIKELGCSSASYYRWKDHQQVKKIRKNKPVGAIR